MKKHHKKLVDNLDFQTPFNLIETLFQRHYNGYYYCRELVVSGLRGDTEPMEMVNCYEDQKGFWIGDASMARYLCVKCGIRQLQPLSKESNICSIGFNEKEQKWYGWGHRALCGFGVGDRIFQERFGNDNTPFSKHGRKTIVKLSEAKVAAKRFAKSVS